MMASTNCVCVRGASNLPNKIFQLKADHKKGKKNYALLITKVKKAIVVKLVYYEVVSLLTKSFFLYKFQQFYSNWNNFALKLLRGTKKLIFVLN